MIVEVPVVGKIGDRLTAYFREFGKFEGSISDTMDRSFLLEMEMVRARREKLSDMLTWLEKKQKDASIRDVRKQTRIVPPDPHSTVTLSSTFRHPALRFRRRCSLRSECRSRSEPALGASSIAAQRFRRQIRRAAESKGPRPPHRESESKAHRSRSRLIPAGEVLRSRLAGGCADKAAFAHPARPDSFIASAPRDGVAGFGCKFQTADACRHSRGMICPRSCGKLVPSKRKGAGNVGCALHPRSRATYF
jgi:hypothetical protein